MAYTINIEKADRVAVLQALYNAAKPQGLGHMQFTPAPLSRIEAERLLELEEDGTPKWPYFDYVNGRVMKVGLHGANVQARLYDEDNGEDAAWTACKDIEGCARVETEPVA